MYVLDFINRVRGAQACEPLDLLPAPGADGCVPIELAMGCRLEAERMRLASPQAAAAVADAIGLPVGVDRMTVALPLALIDFAACLHAERLEAGSRLGSDG